MRFEVTPISLPFERAQTSKAAELSSSTEPAGQPQVY